MQQCIYCLSTMESHGLELVTTGPGPNDDATVDRYACPKCGATLDVSHDRHGDEHRHWSEGRTT